ncbi:unnamed protein product [Trichogramma brassicae]|uniref:Uncharacterized protein n=1 Tax=Trichogramma brassicae TaxID=86971 RepID=A0A6H5I4P0_9HYME|nr:unnamed protein product [Trichogramma brassicae]
MADRANGMNQEPDMRSAAEKEEDKQQSEKANEYVRELLQEKHQLENAPNAVRLLDQVIQKGLAGNLWIRVQKDVFTDTDNA